MADTADVENALVSAVDALLYPNGQVAYQPNTVAGAPARIIRGWPSQVELDADLANGIFWVSVFPRPNMERSANRYPPIEVDASAPPTTYTLTSTGAAITVGGAAPSPYVAQNLAAFLNGKPYVVQATTGQTAAQVAAALYAVLSGDFPAATINGAAITVPATTRIGPLRVGSTGSWFKEVGRQEKQYQIDFWCPSPDVRDAAVKAVDPALRALVRIALADGSRGNICYRGSNTFDGPQKSHLYRRALFYLVDFPTTLSGPAAQIVAMETDLFAADGTPLNTSYS